LIAFVSNLPQTLRSGGFSAMNAAALGALSQSEPVHYVGPVNPRVSQCQTALSKLCRVMGSSGDFAAFSDRRLARIAREVHAVWPDGARLGFFHGFTPWILTKPRVPYVAWSDCTFRDYVTIFHRRDRFRAADLARIEDAEANWLRAADYVLLTSDWAVERVVLDYALDRARVSSVGIFGEVQAKARDVFEGGKEFAFISTAFQAKGGDIVLAAMRRVRHRHPDASLVVVGDQPQHPTPEPGVTYTGFLRKESPDEYARFERILGSARALVNATRTDTAPVLLAEAASFGCPVISSNEFAIPELVVHGQTGLLLSPPANPEAVAAAMCWMLENEGPYRAMRTAAWNRAHALHLKSGFQRRLWEAVARVQ
jgi:glycosyltransferase involved in cell wall biosynthesis